MQATQSERATREEGQKRQRGKDRIEKEGERERGRIGQMRKSEAE